MNIRLAKWEDSQEILNWWNDPLTRKMMKNNIVVNYEEHKKWFESILNNKNKILLLGFIKNKKIGVVRFDKFENNNWEISINLNPTFRGLGFGKILLSLGIEYMLQNFSVKSFFAKFKNINIASQKTFLANGFIIDNPNKNNNIGTYDFEDKTELYCFKQYKLPPRFAYSSKEMVKINEVIDYYKSIDQDPGYNGKFEKEFCEKFSEYQGGGYTDAVATGTAAIFIALQALQLPKGSDVLISPVTDSGPLNAIIMLGLKPIVMDSAKNSYNINLESFLQKVTPNTSCILLVHTGGEPVKETPLIVKEAKKRGIKVLEDCSQATGAIIEGKRVGTYGDIAAFSTMYRKNLIAGSSGGLVYTKDKNLYHLALAYADRGKQVWREDLNQNDPGNALFPALNFNTDEISCAIGIASLERLDETIEKRKAFLKFFIPLLKESKVCKPYYFDETFSPFFFPIFVDTSKLKCSKIEFAKKLNEYGVGNNFHYGCLISEWEWAKSYLQNDYSTPNAKFVKDNSFNLFLNENYTKEDAKKIIEIIKKVEKECK